MPEHAEVDAIGRYLNEVLTKEGSFVVHTVDVGIVNPCINFNNTKEPDLGLGAFFQGGKALVYVGTNGKELAFYFGDGSALIVRLGLSIYPLFIDEDLLTHGDPLCPYAYREACPAPGEAHKHRRSQVYPHLWCAPNMAAVFIGSLPGYGRAALVFRTGLPDNRHVFFLRQRTGVLDAPVTPATAAAYEANMWEVARTPGATLPLRYPGGPSPFKYLSPWGQMMMAGIADLIFQRCSLADILAGVDRKGKAVEPFMEYFAVRRSSESSSESSDGTGGTVANMLLNGYGAYFASDGFNLLVGSLVCSRPDWASAWRDADCSLFSTPLLPPKGVGLWNALPDEERSRRTVHQLLVLAVCAGILVWRRGAKLTAFFGWRPYAGDQKLANIAFGRADGTATHRRAAGLGRRDGGGQNERVMKERAQGKMKEKKKAGAGAGTGRLHPAINYLKRGETGPGLFQRSYLKRHTAFPLSGKRKRVGADGSSPAKKQRGRGGVAKKAEAPSGVPGSAAASTPSKVDWEEMEYTNAAHTMAGGKVWVGPFSWNLPSDSERITKWCQARGLDPRAPSLLRGQLEEPQYAGRHILRDAGLEPPGPEYAVEDPQDRPVLGASVMVYWECSECWYYAVVTGVPSLSTISTMYPDEAPGSDHHKGVEDLAATPCVIIDGQPDTSRCPGLKPGEVIFAEHGGGFYVATVSEHAGKARYKVVWSGEGGSPALVDLARARFVRVCGRAARHALRPTQLSEMGGIYCYHNDLMYEVEEMVLRRLKAEGGFPDDTRPILRPTRFHAQFVERTGTMLFPEAELDRLLTGTLGRCRPWDDGLPDGSSAAGERAQLVERASGNEGASEKKHKKKLRRSRRRGSGLA